jgi:hypothetical protein
MNADKRVEIKAERERVRMALRERLADLEHQQWMKWAKDVWDQVDWVTAIRWQGYFVPYGELTEEIKNHDRKWADKVLEVFEEVG